MILRKAQKNMHWKTINIQLMFGSDEVSEGVTAPFFG